MGVTRPGRSLSLSLIAKVRNSEKGAELAKDRPHFPTTMRPVLGARPPLVRTLTGSDRNAT